MKPNLISISRQLPQISHQSQLTNKTKLKKSWLKTLKKKSNYSRRSKPRELPLRIYQWLKSNIATWQWLSSSSRPPLRRVLAYLIMIRIWPRMRTASKIVHKFELSIRNQKWKTSWISKCSKVWSKMALSVTMKKFLLREESSAGRTVSMTYGSNNGWSTEGKLLLHLLSLSLRHGKISNQGMKLWRKVLENDELQELMINEPKA